MYNLTVICGIIEYENKVLIGKKIECEHPTGLGGKWHLPGGKVEENEPVEEALKREIKEETDLEIEVKECFGSNNYTSKNGMTIRIVYFRCVPNTYTFKASGDLQKLKWVKKQDVLNELDDHFVKMLTPRLISYFKLP